MNRNRRIIMGLVFGLVATMIWAISATVLYVNKGAAPASRPVAASTTKPATASSTAPSAAPTTPPAAKDYSDEKVAGTIQLGSGTPAYVLTLDRKAGWIADGNTQGTLLLSVGNDKGNMMGIDAIGYDPSRDGSVSNRLVNYDINTALATHVQKATGVTTSRGFQLFSSLAPNFTVAASTHTFNGHLRCMNLMIYGQGRPEILQAFACGDSYPAIVAGVLSSLS